MRTHDTETVQWAIDQLGQEVNASDWLADPIHIALTNDTGDVALFEYGFDAQKIYTGHYCFKSRGRAAIEAARKFLDEIFDPCYNVRIVMGFVPDHRREVKWLSRQIGFKSYGIEELHGNLYELFIITKAEHDK